MTLKQFSVKFGLDVSALKKEEILKKLEEGAINKTQSDKLLQELRKADRIWEPL